MMDINPCKKCGSEAFLEEEPDMIDIVKCSNDDCDNEGPSFYDGATWAVEKWNEHNPTGE